ncbi:MAG: uracil-DNA glycosylase family protein [Phaeodactylibacter sp.]|nr:uracil-DNA glycosylase family protein [Phaeodactylibacter sp.]
MKQLITEIKACTICKEQLPLGPNPVVQLHSEARILIIGQAPGTKVHASGIPFQDASGRRLRDWLGVSEDTFYNARQVAIMPMGFCYPGKGPSGDLPPRKECAPQWHEQVLDQLSDIRLTLLIGQYAQQYYLQSAAGKTLTDTVRRFLDFAPARIPLPHPSPRNIRWFKKNPWFEAEVLPFLKDQVRQALNR